MVDDDAPAAAPGDPPAGEPPAELHAADLALAAAAAAGDPAAIARLDRLLVEIATAAIRALRGGDADRDEVLQDVRARLLVTDGARPPRIADYAGRGELARWLKATVVRTYLNRVRGVRREVGSDDEQVFDRLLSPAVDPELAYLKQRYGAELRTAVGVALAALPDDAKLLLRFRFVDELTIDEIAAIQRVHRGTVHRWLAGARDDLRARVEALLRARLGLSADELDSVFRMVASQLELSLTRVLT